MLVSVVINNYNYGDFLNTAIDGVLAQTYPNIELIVVDDGSTDSSRDVITSYGDKVIPIFKGNGGQASAANAGWEVCKGDIVLFLDSDDVYQPETVERCVQAFSSGDFDKVQFLQKRVNKDLKPIGGALPTYGIGHEDVRKDVWSWGYYRATPGSGNAYRRKFLETALPAPITKPVWGYDLPPDGYLCALAGITGKVCSIPEELGLYRVHGRNASNAGHDFSTMKLRRLFMIDYIREELQAEYALKQGIVPPKPDLSRFHPTVCKDRFIAFRLHHDGHPLPQDTYWGLLLSALRGALTFPYLKPQKRLYVFTGFIVMAVMPKKMLAHFTMFISGQDKKMGFKRLWLSLTGQVKDPA